MRSRVVDVFVVSADRTPITMMPALSIKPQAMLEALDQAHPDGADYVVVPAFHHDERVAPNPEWLRRRATSPATIVRICEGARLLGRAGLLDGRRATRHWYADGGLQRSHPRCSGRLTDGMSSIGVLLRPPASPPGSLAPFADNITDPGGIIVVRIRAEFLSMPREFPQEGGADEFLDCLCCNSEIAAVFRRADAAQ